MIRHRNQYKKRTTLPFFAPCPKTIKPRSRAVHYHIDNKKALRITHIIPRNNVIVMEPHLDHDFNTLAQFSRLIWPN